MFARLCTAQWIGALGTIAAVVVALFKESFLLWWRKPELVVECKNSPPWTVKAKTIHGNWNGYSYWIRIHVFNSGNTRAEKVQVSLSRLQYSSDKNAGFSDQTMSHLPLNLKWSHLSVPILDGISPKMSALCDVICLCDPKNPYWTQHQPMLKGKTIGQLQLEVNLPEEYQILRPGVWKLTIQIAAANATPVKKILTFSHTGEWLDNDAEMREKCLMISLE